MYNIGPTGTNYQVPGMVPRNSMHTKFGGFMEF